jgi:C-terminal peptidase prc
VDRPDAIRLASAEDSPLYGKVSADKDYWAKVRFERVHFREIEELIRLHYIDGKTDGPFALQRGANFALGRVNDRWHLLPAKYVKRQRKKEPKRKFWKGKVKRVKPGDPYVILEHVKDWAKDARRKMSDDEIRAEREKRREDYGVLKGAWADAGFDRKDFREVLAYAVKNKKDDLRTDMIWVAAAQGFLGALDPHSSLISKEAWKESTAEIRDGSFSGIGALLTQRYEEIIIESPLQGQPAAKSGLRAGDVIVKVDDLDIRGMPLSKVVQKIRGPKATKVVLTVQRVGVPEDLVFPITRALIPYKNVSERLLGPEHAGIGMVKVRGFVSGTTLELRTAIESLAEQSPTGKLKGLVLDLRNNSGGLLQEAVLMSDLFVKSGVIVSVRSRTSQPENYEANAGKDVSMPVVVLVDHGTASAAEIVADAIQKNNRGIVIGDRTFGKATVQSLLTPVLGIGYYVKLTVARYYGPKGDTIQVQGISPDFSVSPEPDGKMPLGFREENLYDHLPKMKRKVWTMDQTLANELKACVERTGRAKKMYARDPNPAIKFDFQLYTGADYLDCVVGQVAAR